MYKELNKLQAVHGSYEDFFGGGTSKMATTDYSQADMGDNPAVNLATGRLRYSFDDLSVGYGNFAVNVGHVYLSQYYSEFVKQFPELAGGWKLNVAQYLLQTDGSTVLYMDESGEVHRFVKYADGRYYDERNAKVTLNYKYNQIYLEDGVNNRIYFKENGRVDNTKICHDSTMVKNYRYDERDRLVAIYDNRVVNPASGAKKTQILFGYDYANRLISATAYVNYTKLLSSVTYEYDVNGRLTKVNRAAYNRKGAQCLVTPSLGFEYANGLLTQATDLETKSAYRFTYDGGKISKVEQGVIKSHSVGMGMTDADGNNLACGIGLCCGAPAQAEFITKSSNSYTYNYNGGDTLVSSETHVTNRDGITLAYFINRDACVVSSFEKISNKLYTLEKQGAKTTGIDMGGVSTARINQETAFTVNGIYTVLDNAKFEVTRSDKEQGLRRFNYSFWLKLPISAKYMQAKIVYKFSTASEQTSVTLIDGKAVNAWQRVSLSLSAPLRRDDDTKTDTLSYLKVQLLNNNQPYTGAYEFSEIGFAPAPYTELYYILAAPMSQLSKFTLTTVREDASCDTKECVLDEQIYFTESDVLASVRNRVTKTYSISYHRLFDLVCNNGTKRIPNVEQIAFDDNGVKYEPSFGPSVKMYMPDGKTEITTTYKYGPRNITVETVGCREGVSSSATVEIDYYGKTLKETDEYGVSKNYEYNDYGDLTKAELVGSRGTVGSVTYYRYDDEGRLLRSHDGVTGQSVDYTEYDQVGTVTEGKVVNGGFQSTSHNVTNSYGVFRNNTLAVTEYNNGKQLSRRDATYEQGRIRTVSDGLAKYGVKYNLAHNTVEYTQFDKAGAEKLIQRDSVENDRGSYISQKHRSEFYEDNAVKDSVTTELTKYGKINAVTHKNAQGGEVRNTYVYDSPNESVFTALLTTHTDNDNGTITDYYYNDDGELMCWEEKDNARQTQLKVQQISDNVTKYNYGLDWEFLTDITYDNTKILSPRVTEVTYHRHASDSTDEFMSHYTPHQHTYDEFGRLSTKYSKNFRATNYNYRNLAGKSRLQSVLFEYGDRSSAVSDAYLVRMGDELDYYNDGRLKSSNLWVGQKQTKANNWELNRTVQSRFYYDGVGRLTSVDINKDGTVSTQNVSYRDDGRISYATINGEDIDFGYNSLGQMSRAGDYTYEYDTYGNRIAKWDDYNDKPVTEYKYARGGQLVQAGNVHYAYNKDGVLRRKTCGNTTTDYLLDGNKILGINILGSNKFGLRFMYDLTGLDFMRYDNVDYEYVSDSQGNVIMLIDPRTETIAARYEYDLFGNCTVYNADNVIDTAPYSVGNVNPFRWKGLYYDSDTGLYYANGSFYDPTTVSYVDAAPIESVFGDVFTARNLDRTCLLCNNILELAGNPYNIYTTQELAVDTTYTPKYTWLTHVEMSIAKAFRWYKRQHWFVKYALGMFFLTIAVILTIETGGSVGAILIDLAIGIGFGIGGYLLGSLLTQQALTWEGLGNAVLDAFLFTSAFLFISSGINAIKYLCRSKSVSTVVLDQQIYPPNNGAVVGTEQTITLQPGTYGRYGTISSQSNYITQSGASASQLSLPPWNDGVYIKIRVLKPIEGVVQSTVAAWAPWNGVGGGIQYMLPQPIDMLKIAGYLIY